MSEHIIHTYLGGLTAKRGEDGFLRVKGIATDETLDLDEQICDSEWLKSAMPAWMSVGNIREMHQSKAIGKAVEMEESGTGFVVTAKIVDEQAAKMVEEDIYTGFSIGIKGARIVKDANAPGGRIVGGKIVELSLVDRPANPSAVIEIAKSVDGELIKGSAVADIEKFDDVQMEADVIPASPHDTGEAPFEMVRICHACSGTKVQTNVPGDTAPCEVCNGTGVEPEDSIESITQQSPSTLNADENSELKAVDAEVEKGGPGSGPHPGDGKPSFESAHLADGKLDFTNQQKIDNAIQMYGRGSKQHLEAIRRFGGKKSADAVTTTADFKSALQEFKAVRPDLVKADDKEHNLADLNAVRASLIALIKAELDEMLAGDENEISDVMQLLCALKMYLDWWTSEASENETEAPFTGWDEEKDDDTMAYVGLGVSADLIKSASSKDATEEVKAELRQEIVKALGLTEEIATYKALIAGQEDVIKGIKAELDEVKEMAVPGGPALRQTSAQVSKSAQATALQVEAERRRYLASQITDPEMKNAYLDAATSLDRQASTF